MCPQAASDTPRTGAGSAAPRSSAPCQQEEPPRPEGGEGGGLVRPKGCGSGSDTGSGRCARCLRVQCGEDSVFISNYSGVEVFGDPDRICAATAW